MNTRENALQSFYETDARIGTSANPRTNMALDLLLSTRPKRVLDVGCGDATTSSKTSRMANFDIYGVDISSIAVEKAASYGVKAQRVDISTESLPFENGFFDAVFATEILEHLMDPDFAILEINRVLRTNGSLIVSTPNLGAWYNRLVLLIGFQPFSVEVSTRENFGRVLRKTSLPVGHIRSFTLPALVQFLRRYGFRTKLVNGCYFDHAPLVFLDKLFSRIPSLASDLIVLAEKNQTC